MAFMPSVKMGMQVKESGGKIFNLIRGFAFARKMEVVVGITEESNTARESGIDNAGLLYLHENGSPVHNIPPRPVLQPAIAQDGVREKIMEMMKGGMKAALLGNITKAEQMYNKAGMIGRDACKKYITDGGNLAPNAPSTIQKKGSSTPLIDTASMLNSITYAVRKKR